MDGNLKMLFYTLFGGVYGSALLFLWFNPATAPVWAAGTGLRKVFLLSRDFEPTIFTLFIGVMMILCFVLGSWRLATGRGPAA